MKMFVQAKVSFTKALKQDYQKPQLIFSIKLSNHLKSIDCKEKRIQINNLLN